MPRNWASFPPASLPVITITVHGTIVRALADTGAARSLIDPRLVRQLELKEKGSGWVVSIRTSPEQVPLVTVEEAAIGHCKLPPFEAAVTDLTNLRIGIQIVLGINAFTGYRLQFDFAEGNLYLLS